MLFNHLFLEAAQTLASSGDDAAAMNAAREAADELTTAQTFEKALEIMGLGMLGIFVVILLLIIIVYGLGRFGGKKPEENA